MSHTSARPRFGKVLHGDLQAYILGRECVAGHITVAVALGGLCRGNLGRIDFLALVVSRSGDIPRTCLQVRGFSARAGSLCLVFRLVTWLCRDGHSPGRGTLGYRTDI